MCDVITSGVDLAKSVFQGHGVDAEGVIVVRRQLRRRRVTSAARAATVSYVRFQGSTGQLSQRRRSPSLTQAV
jgi:hypothetical protein